MTPNPSSRALVLGVASLLLLTVTGCPSTPSGRRGPARPVSSGQGRSDQTALFNSIRDKLRRLPESAQMDLSPPTVILSARQSLDGEDVQALLLPQPGAPDGPAKRIVVPRGNCRFRNTVKPGDIVKYYVKPDQATMDRLDETGEVEIATFDAVDLIVAQVVGETELLVVRGLPQPFMQPSKLEVWRISDDRMDDISRTLGEYRERRKPPIGWQPSPDEAPLGTLTELLNQWLRQTRGAGDRVDPSGWSRPGLLATLPAEVAEEEAVAALLSDSNLGAGYFATHEVRSIQAATWSRDIASWARGSETSPAGLAAAFVDWTARNVQPAEADEVPPRFPWEAMLSGRATVATTAEVLVGLCRQRGLIACVLEVPAEEGSAEELPTRLLLGVLDGDQLRLYDPELGSPVPGEGPEAVATLSEALADDAVLRRLDLPDAPYPVTAEKLATAKVYAVASPLELSRRAKALALKLGGEDRVSLYVDLDVEAERLARAEGVDEVALWPAPLRTVVAKQTVKKKARSQAVREFLPYAWRPQLWRGRLLHFRGANLDADGVANATAETANDHLVARRFYMNPAVRPGDDRLARVPENKRDIYRLAKTLATLFVAQLSYDSGSYARARKWLEVETLSDEFAAAYRPGVDYNLGRALEQLGESEAAIAAYEAVTGPRRHGARLRAERLKANPSDDSSEAP